MLCLVPLFFVTRRIIVVFFLLNIRIREAYPSERYPNGNSAGSDSDIQFSTVEPRVLESWFDAKDKCHSRNGTLAIADTKDKHKALTEFRQTLPNRGDPIWIGLKADRGRWVWVDRSVALALDDFQNWQQPPPSPPASDAIFCVAVVKASGSSGYELKWKKFPCVVKLSYICSKTPKTASTESTEKESKETFWIKRYPDSRCTAENLGVMTPGVSSPIQCAMLCLSTSAPSCKAFNYSPKKKVCVFLKGEILPKKMMSHQEDWDVWEENPSH